MKTTQTTMLLERMVVGTVLSFLVSCGQAELAKTNASGDSSVSSDVESVYRRLVAKLDSFKEQKQAICPLDEDQDLESQRESIEACIASNEESFEAVVSAERSVAEACLPVRKAPSRNAASAGRPPQPPRLPESFSQIPKNMQASVKAKLLSNECSAKLGSS